jgi:hypothetical protein
VPTKENFLTNLPDDKEVLKAMLRSLWQERERLEKRAEEQRQRADELYLEKLRLQLELERYKKATYGPRADRLSMNQLAQMLLEFAEALEQKPIHLGDLQGAEPEPEVRRVKRRKGRRAPANFENLPGQHAGIRVERRRAALSELWCGAQRDRQREELANRVYSRTLRTP